MDELELELIDIIHSLKSRLKRVNKLIQLLPYEEDLYYAKEKIIENIEWYESFRINKKTRRKFPSIRRTFGEVVYEVKFMYLRVLESKHNKKKKDNENERRARSYLWPFYRATERQ